MIDQLKTIREALDSAATMTIEQLVEAQKALTELEAMVWEQKPVAWAMPKGDGTFIDVITPAEHAREEGSYTVPLFAHPVAQQPQACPDFTDEWTGYLKDGETPFERFLRDRKDLQSILKLYQRVLEENERLKGQQPQAEPDIHEAQGQIEFLDKKNNALSAAIRKVMARLADLLDEDQFKEIEETISSAGVQPQAEAVPPDVARDAERYRCIKELSAKPTNFYSGDERWCVSREQGGMGQNFFGDRIDAAIDAAIAQQKGQP